MPRPHLYPVRLYSHQIHVAHPGSTLMQRTIGVGQRCVDVFYGQLVWTFASWAIQGVTTQPVPISLRRSGCRPIIRHRYYWCPLVYPILRDLEYMTIPYLNMSIVFWPHQHSYTSFNFLAYFWSRSNFIVRLFPLLVIASAQWLA